MSKKCEKGDAGALRVGFSLILGLEVCSYWIEPFRGVMQKPQFLKDVPADHLETAKAAFSESVPLKRLGTVQEVASAYVHLMTNGFITGQVLAVDSGVMLRK